MVLAWLAVQACLLAAEEPEPRDSRSFFAVSSALTVGELGPSGIGGGVGVKWGNYLDPSRPSGLYYGFFSGYFYHSVGRVQLTDVKYVTLGWRGLLAPWVGLDAAVSPVLGGRIDGDKVDGSAYLGLCPSLGFFVPASARLDVALSYEPVINLFTLSGSSAAPYTSYSDIVLSLVVRRHTQVKELPWR
jgi:hypothetical protein